MRPQTHLDYLIKDSQCADAIEALREYQDLTKWMQAYEVLFKELVMAPPGLPIVIKGSLNGFEYSNIQHFCEFYLELKR